MMKVVFLDWCSFHVYAQAVKEEKTTQSLFNPATTLIPDGFHAAVLLREKGVCVCDHAHTIQLAKQY